MVIKMKYFIIALLLTIPCHSWGGSQEIRNVIGMAKVQSSGISDDFSSDTSANYTAIESGMTITGGYAYGNTQYVNCAVYHETATGSNNHFVQADIEIATASTAYVILRSNGTTGYAVRMVAGPGAVKLYTFNGTTFTDSSKYWNVNITAGTLYTIKIQVSGSTFTAYQNSTQIMSTYNSSDGVVSDSTYSTGQYVGLGWDRGAGYNPRIDNLSASSL